MATLAMDRLERDASISSRPVTVFRTAAELEAIRGTWKRLQAHPNAQMDFFLTICKSRPEVLSPYVLVQGNPGNPESMMIGRLEQRPLEFHVGYKTIARIESRVIAMIYGGSLGAQSAELQAAYVRQLLHAIAAGEADAVFLNSIRKEGSLYQLATTLPSLVSRDRAPATNTHWRMRLNTSPDHEYHKLSDGSRWQLRKFAKDFKNLRVEIYSSADSIGAVCRDVEHITASTYHRAMGVGFRDNEENRKRLTLLAQQRRLKAYVLYVGELPCAFWIGNRFDNVFYADFTGYDPAFKKYSPGTFLFLKMVEDLYSCGVAELDFGSGDALYKQRFGTDKWEEASVYIFAPTFKGLLLNGLKTTTTLVSRAAESLLKDVRSLQKIKTLWRTQLRKRNPEAQ